MVFSAGFCATKDSSRKVLKLPLNMQFCFPYSSEFVFSKRYTVFPDYNSNCYLNLSTMADFGARSLERIEGQGSGKGDTY